MAEATVKIRCLVNGQALQLTADHEIRFEQHGLDFDNPVPVLYHKGRRNNKSLYIKADIYVPAKD